MKGDTVMEIKKGGFYLRTEDSSISFIKGNVYKSPKDGSLIDKIGVEREIHEEHLTNKIAVHVPTQEDWDYVIGKVREEYYNDWDIYGKVTCIELSNGCHDDAEWYECNNYHIITIDQFRALFKDEDPKHEKVCIRGHKTRYAEVLAKLESLGGVVSLQWSFNDDARFFLVDNKGDTAYSTYRPKGYTEIFLDEPYTEEQNITELKSDKTDSSGYKQSENKLSYELDWNFITQMAERMEANKGKYEPYNWKKPIDTQELRNAITRHAIEIAKGNFSDDGRPFGHLEALACNSMMLNFQLQNKK